MSDPTIRVADRIDLLAAETSEGAQGLQSRSVTNTDDSVASSARYFAKAT